MRITFIIQDMYRLGAQYVTSLIANELAEQGHDIVVVVSNIENRIKSQRPDISPFQLIPEIDKKFLPHDKASQNVFAIARYLKKNKPDVLIPMSSNYILPSALALKLAGGATALIPVEHSSGIGLNISRTTKRKRILENFQGLGNWILSKQVYGIIAVSKGVKEALITTKQYPSEKIKVVYNPVVSEGFFKKLKESSSHPWLINKNTPVIVAAGAHVPFKGHDILIKAMAEVNKRRACKLIIFGEGVLTNNLKKLAVELNLEDKISFPGYSNNLPAELKAADAFVVSSHAESFSVVLVEALASGTPVVATNCPSGPPEILHNGKYGIMVEPNNVKKLAFGIMKVLKGEAIIPPEESWKPYVVKTVAENYLYAIKKIVD